MNPNVYQQMNGILCSFKKEETPVTCCVKLKDKGQILYDSTHIKYPK